jgi:hypothetical protein
MKTYIIGPSHIHSDYTSVIYKELQNNILFKNCYLDAHKGLPIWSKYIETKVLEKMNDNNIVWIVSDYKFNNFDYPKILELQKTNSLFIDTMGHPGNVHKDFMGPIHTEVLGNHSLQVIDHIIALCPKIKLIFWCLYKRSKANKSSNPQYLWYDTIKEKYKNNIIDIDNFINVNKFNSLTIDGGGHPNKQGLELLSKMVESINK